MDLNLTEESEILIRGLDERFRDHPHFDPQSLRVLLTKSEIENLPIKVISLSELFEKKKSWFWNGPEWYPEDIRNLECGEVGYDDEARYVMKVVDVKK